MTISMKKTNTLMILFVALLALALTLGLCSSGVSAANPTTHNDITITFGDTSTPTPPESLMDIEAVSGDTFHADYTGGDSATFYPSILSIYIEPADEYASHIDSITASGVSFVTYDAGGNPTVSDTTTVNASGYYTIQPKVTWATTRTITVENEDTNQFILTFDAPKSNPVGGGTCPPTVSGYLPIGQYANGTNWGSICTDQTNTGATKKFVGGYIGTGSSLGALGGYVQFDMGAGNGIANNDKNPYGIDFVVYGNPFNGNPEAGCVQVSNDGTTWYTLAGSLHYDSDTTWGNTVTYMKIAAANTVIDGDNYATAGVWYSTDYVPTDSTTQATVDDAIGDATWTLFKNNVNWWPEYTSENYGGVYGDVDDVTWNRNGTAEVISMAGLTRLKDDAEYSLSGNNATNHYGYGYADVRAKGSSYGNAINPYASLPAASAGGDGFDLDWAVQANGNSQEMNSARYIRVYTGVLYNGTFGETSTEICGLYVANADESAVGTTGAPTMTLNAATSYNVTDPNSDGIATVTIPYNDNSATFTLTATAAATDNFWMNNTKTTSGTAVSFAMPSAGDTERVRIVAQDDDDQPYILLVKVTKAAS